MSNNFLMNHLTAKFFPASFSIFQQYLVTSRNLLVCLYKFDVAFHLAKFSAATFDYQNNLDYLNNVKLIFFFWLGKNSIKV